MIQLASGGCCPFPPQDGGQCPAQDASEHEKPHDTADEDPGRHAFLQG